MDWAWLRGTLVRNAGWTFQQCGEQSVADVFEFLEHLADHPPDYVILAGYYGVPQARKKPDAARNSPDDLNAVRTLLGGGGAVPDDVAEQISWFESFGPANHA